MSKHTHKDDYEPTLYHVYCETTGSVKILTHVDRYVDYDFYDIKTITVDEAIEIMQADGRNVTREWLLDKLKGKQNANNH